MSIDLSQDDVLRNTLAKVNPEERSEWVRNLEELLSYVQQADLETRRSKAFHKRIWEENAVSDIGMGTVDISAAIDDAGFRNWFAEESVKPLPEGYEEKLVWFNTFYGEIVKRLKQFSSRTARVKIFRVLAAHYPQYFTTITHVTKALELHRKMFGKVKKPDHIRRQLEIRERIDRFLEPCSDDLHNIAARMTIPWLLYRDYVQKDNDEADTEEVDITGEVKLVPLPALQRRKGLTSIRGGLATIATALSFVTDGVSRNELTDYLRTEFPDYRDSTIRTLINILKNEFYVIKDEDGLILPTSRGESFLENSDPQELIPLFLTRTLGVDHVLLALKAQTMDTGSLVSLLKRVNPGWTSEYSPRAMLKWLRDFELIELDEGGHYFLTDNGKSWAGHIHWEPEFLPMADEGEVELPATTGEELEIGDVDASAVIDAVIDATAFLPKQVSQLHLGLWSHPKRHFAILAGLSGSGKTQLALRYGRALAAQFAEQPDRNVFIQAVQPGWYDPAPLFGYINPLRPDSYVRPPLLDFLLLAAQHPEQPFTVILDEMNLSHPEQYFAPVLSAMESGERLRLHNEGAAFDGVPATIGWPANVAFIGTVNMDETTHGISDKVLDRAFTLEFWDVNLDDYPAWQREVLDDTAVAKVRACLGELLQVLAPERLHFGWRTVEDVLSYLDMAAHASSFELDAALDDVIYARVLPKLRGTDSNRLHDALQNTIAVLQQHGLERSRTKVQSLKTDLADTGMMRFWR
ncbi:MAG: hypothetical protein R6X15_04150 [Pseudomonadota bacterium]